MIEQLRLQGLGVIAAAELRFGPGFTAITGETGAGKTMVVTGLGLILGRRAEKGAVRADADSAQVDGIWIVSESGPVAERVREAGGEVEPIGQGRAELYLGRTLTAEGRSRARVGGIAAPAGVLADLADQLVVVHGQSDQIRLRSASAQRDALDRFGGEAIAAALEKYRSDYRRHQQLVTEYVRLEGDRDARAEEAERLRALIAEVEQIAPVVGEDADLARRAERLINAEQLRAAAALAHLALSGDATSAGDDSANVIALLAQARQAVERAGDETLAQLGEHLAELGYRAVDAAGTLARFIADLEETGPAELDAVQQRRALLGGLIRDHGSLEEAIALAEVGSARLAELDDDGERIARLAADQDEAAAAVDISAATLSAARRAAAETLAQRVTEELGALAMPDANLQVAVTAAAASVHGRDEVEFLLAAHPGAAARPISRAASGGELSRVMLAIEVVIAATDPVATFVFDEIDAGIGGAAAIEIGRRLAALAETSQVIVVTHLAQVAAFAGTHLSVVKATDGTVTTSDVHSLVGAAREAEMARLLSGMTHSSAAIEHARELLALADR